MALPALLRKVFESDGYGPKLNRSIIPFAASLASSAASDVASAEWVKDFAGPYIYIDSSKVASGDGLSAATAVRTFSEAVILAASFPSPAVNFVVAAGTYSDFSVDRSINVSRIAISLNGNITINGNFSVLDCQNFVIVGNSHSITVNGKVVISHSFVSFACSLSITCSTSGLYSAFQVTSSSFVSFAGASLSITSIGSPIVIESSSIFLCYASVTLTASALADTALVVQTNSFGFFAEHVELSNGSAFFLNGIITSYSSMSMFAGGVTINTNSIRRNGIEASVNSGCYLGGSNKLYQLYGSATVAGIPLIAYYCSSIFVAASATVSARICYGGIRGGVVAGMCSNIEFSADSYLNTVFGGNATSATAAIRSELGSTIHFAERSNWWVGAGTFTYGTAVASDCSSIGIHQDASVSGETNNIYGKRYVSDRNSSIDVYNKGASRIPGRDTGSVTNGGVYA